MNRIDTILALIDQVLDNPTSPVVYLTQSTDPNTEGAQDA